MRLTEGVDILLNPLPKEGVFSKESMVNIFATIPTNIFVNPNIMENVQIGANCSPKEVAIYTSLFK